MSAIKYALIIVFVILLQISIVEPFINSYYFLNIPLITIIFFNWAKPSTGTLWFTLLLSLGLSYFDGLIFGITLLLMLLTAIVIQYFSLNLLTNRSLGSLLFAGVIGVTVYIVMITTLSITEFGLPFDQIEYYLLDSVTIIANIFLTLSFLFIFKHFIFLNEITEI